MIQNTQTCRPRLEDVQTAAAALAWRNFFCSRAPLAAADAEAPVQGAAQTQCEKIAASRLSRRRSRCAWQGVPTRHREERGKNVWVIEDRRRQGWR